MSLALGVVGGLLIAVVFADALMTTLTVSAGSGPLTGRVLSAVWWLLMRLHRRGRRTVAMRAGGPAMLILTVLIWVSLLWAGWVLLFLAGGAVAHDDAGGDTAGAVDVVYFSGMVLFTLGTGDVVAASPGWRLASIAAAFNGLFLVTLAITYLISVVSAVVGTRGLALHIHALGEDAHDIVLRGWNRDGFSATFEQHLVSLTPTMTASAEQHLAYPVLHYFHSSEPAVAVPRQMAHLDDAVVLMCRAVAPEHRPDPSATAPLSLALHRYIRTVTGVAWTPDVGVPPAPDPRPLADAGIPLAPEEDLAALDAADERHRSMLHALVVREGWAWDS